ncbi:hypothetical protein N7456_006980 [Penicillium angulare]|uniref:Uncharacterized protein n=1 Tax=Penicillium angulare TaxID=116970 RepID=A0A9W9FIN8_9EURO|nr:hypothetical protein N7456_006980 [Penicillium angulare]
MAERSEIPRVPSILDSDDEITDTVDRDTYFSTLTSNQNQSSSSSSPQSLFNQSPIDSSYHPRGNKSTGTEVPGDVRSRASSTVTVPYVEPRDGDDRLPTAMIPPVMNPIPNVEFELSSNIAASPASADTSGRRFSLNTTGQQQGINFDLGNLRGNCCYTDAEVVEIDSSLDAYPNHASTATQGSGTDTLDSNNGTADVNDNNIYPSISSPSAPPSTTTPEHIKTIQQSQQNQRPKERKHKETSGNSSKRQRGNPAVSLEDDCVQTPTPPSSACSSTSETPPSSDLDGQIAEGQSSTAASPLSRDTTDPNDGIVEDIASDAHLNPPIGYHVPQSIIEPLPFYQNSQEHKSANSLSRIMRVRSSTVVNCEIEGQDGRPFAEILSRPNEWPDVDTNPLPLAEPGPIIPLHNPNPLQHGSSPSTFWDQVQLDRRMTEGFDPMESSAVFSVFPNPPHFDTLPSGPAAQIDHRMTEGFDPMESSAVFSVFPNPPHFDTLPSGPAAQIDHRMTEGFDPLESSAVFSVFPNPTHFDTLPSGPAAQIDHRMTEGFDPLESSAVFSVFPNPTHFDPLSSDAFNVFTDSLDNILADSLEHNPISSTH